MYLKKKKILSPLFLPEILAGGVYKLVEKLIYLYA